MAQWSVKLPALLALVATQVGLLASQVSGFHCNGKWYVLIAIMSFLVSTYTQPIVIFGANLAVTGRLVNKSNGHTMVHNPVFILLPASLSIWHNV